MADGTPIPSHSELVNRWNAIARTGGIEAWVRSELDSGGFTVERRDTDELSKGQLADYKKALKAEAAERRRLSKLAWVAYKANHLVHLGDGVYWNDAADIDKWDLDEPESRARENELPVLDSPQQLADALEIDIPTLRRLTYHRDAATWIPYTRFTIPKRSGGERPIWAPMPQLKAIQRWILHNIVERLPVHGAAHAFLPGRSIASNARAHTSSRMVLQMDLQEFFPTVTFRRARGVFRKAGYREQVATLLALLCTESPRKVVEHDGQRFFVSLGPRCLPQGAPTSPGITNTLCLQLDRRLTGLSKKLGWRYTRYADDLTFSLPLGHKDSPHLGKLMGGVNVIVSSEGFSINEKKTRVSRKGSRQQVTGLIVNGQQGPRVPREKKRMLRAVIHNLENGQSLHEEDSIHTMLGWAAYVHMTEPKLGARYLQQLAPFME